MILQSFCLMHGILSTKSGQNTLALLSSNNIFLFQWDVCAMQQVKHPLSLHSMRFSKFSQLTQPSLRMLLVMQTSATGMMLCTACNGFLELLVIEGVLHQNRLIQASMHILVITYCSLNKKLKPCCITRRMSLQSRCTVVTSTVPTPKFWQQASLMTIQISLQL